MSILGERERLVLHTIVDAYIQNSEPVGSRNVSKIGPLRMSPATIRNIMGDLEEKGYLEQPHASAGRVPTDLGYRYYIDHLVALESVEPKLMDNLERTLDFSSPNMPALMQEFSKRLGALTNTVGFVVASRTDMSTVRQVEFTRLNKHSVLAVLITKAGFVQNVLLNLDVGFSDADLAKLSHRLNEQLTTIGMDELVEKLRQEFDSGAKEVWNILHKLVAAEEDRISGSVFLEGTSNIVNFPEFQDSQKLKNLLSALEEKKSLAEILEKFMNTKGVQVFVGSEVGMRNMEELGLVAQSYGKDGRVLGMLGVIGPKRMEYSKMVKVVNYSVQIISQMIEQLHGGYHEE